MDEKELSGLKLSQPQTIWGPDAFQKDLEGFITKTQQLFLTPKKSDDLNATRTPANVVTKINDTKRFGSITLSAPTKVAPTRRASDDTETGDDLEELIKRVEELETQLETLTYDLEQLEAHLQELQLTVDTAVQDITTLTERVVAIEEQYQQLVSQIYDIEQDIISLTDRVSSVESKNQELESKIYELESRINNASIDAQCSSSGVVTVTLRI